MFMVVSQTGMAAGHSSSLSQSGTQKLSPKPPSSPPPTPPTHRRRPPPPTSAAVRHRRPPVPHMTAAVTAAASPGPPPFRRRSAAAYRRRSPPTAPPPFTTADFTTADRTAAVPAPLHRRRTAADFTAAHRRRLSGPTAADFPVPTAAARRHYPVSSPGFTAGPSGIGFYRPSPPAYPPVSSRRSRQRNREKHSQGLAVKTRRGRYRRHSNTLRLHRLQNLRLCHRRSQLRYRCHRLRRCRHLCRFGMRQRRRKECESTCAHGNSSVQKCIKMCGGTGNRRRQAPRRDNEVYMRSGESAISNRQFYPEGGGQVPYSCRRGNHRSSAVEQPGTQTRPTG